MTLTYKKVVKIYTAYEINSLENTQGANCTLGHSLFGAVKLTKNADFDKYKYSGYGIEFDAHRIVLLSDGSGFGKNVIKFGTDMGSSVQIDNKKKDILILGKGQTDDLDDTTLKIP